MHQLGHFHFVIPVSIVPSLIHSWILSLRETQWSWVNSILKKFLFSLWGLRFSFYRKNSEKDRERSLGNFSKIAGNCLNCFLFFISSFILLSFIPSFVVFFFLSTLLKFLSSFLLSTNMLLHFEYGKSFARC